MDDSDRLENDDDVAEWGSPDNAKKEKQDTAKESISYEDATEVTVLVPSGRALITVDEEKWLQFKEKMKCKHTGKCTEAIQISEIDCLFDSVLVCKADALATSTTISLGKKPARKDELKKLGKIAHALLKLSNFPEIGPLTLSNLIETVLVLNDDRTRKKYLDWVLQYSKVIKEDNSEYYDVTKFVNLMLRSEIR